MRVKAILNGDSGSLASLDIEVFSRTLSDAFVAEGHEIDVEIADKNTIVSLIEAAGAAPDVDALIAGGGDGTVSCAAAQAWKTGKVLGVLPAGTLNLFARATGVPLDLTEAALALATANVADVDIATANGRPFVHHFSVGLQPWVVKKRDNISYSSRFGKMLAGLKALFSAFTRLPRFSVQLELDDQAINTKEALSMLVVSNNVFSENHLPYSDKLDAGVLGLYYSKVVSLKAGLKLVSDFALGTSSTNPDVLSAQARTLNIEFSKTKRKSKAVIDGELIDLEQRVDLRLHPKALRVMMPQS